MSQYVGTARLGSHQSVAYTGTAGTISTAITTGTNKVRVVVTTAAYIKIGSSPTATTSDVYMSADSAEYFTINPGEKVSAVQLSSGGTLHVTEVS
jgi:hypothetical protein